MLILLSATPFPPELKGILFYIQVRLFQWCIYIYTYMYQGMPFAISAFPLSTWRGNQIVCYLWIYVHVISIWSYSQIGYISSALSLYFPWDFCLYTQMSALASNFYSYIPFIIAIIIVAIILKYRYLHIQICTSYYTMSFWHNIRPRGYTSETGKKFQAAYYKFRTRVPYGIWILILLMFLRVLYNALTIFNCEQLTGNGLVSVTGTHVLYNHQYYDRAGILMVTFNASKTTDTHCCLLLEVLLHCFWQFYCF